MELIKLNTKFLSHFANNMKFGVINFKRTAIAVQIRTIDLFKKWYFRNAIKWK